MFFLWGRRIVSKSIILVFFFNELFWFEKGKKTQVNDFGKFQFGWSCICHTYSSSVSNDHTVCITNPLCLFNVLVMPVYYPQARLRSTHNFHHEDRNKEIKLDSCVYWNDGQMQRCFFGSSSCNKTRSVQTLACILPFQRVMIWNGHCEWENKLGRGLKSSWSPLVKA